MVGLELGWWHVAEFAQQSPVVEPVDPFQGGEFEVFEASSGSKVADKFGLVEAVDGFGHGVVVAVTS